MIQIESPQSQTSRSTLIAAFRRVVAINGRRQATDLHVRRLLCYIRAKDVDGQGAQRSLKQIANRLVLSVPTCRRVIRRAVKRFGLLIVIPQRNTPGGQSANRYFINWHHVDTILSSNSFPGNTDVLVGSSDLSSGASSGTLKSRARSKRIPPASESTSPGHTDTPVRLAPPARIDHPLIRSNKTPARPARTRAPSKRFPPENSSPGNTDVLVGSSDLTSGASTGILKSRAQSKRIPPASESTSPGNIHIPVRLATPVCIDHPRIRLNNTSALSARTRAPSKRFPPENSSPRNTDVLVGSSDASFLRLHSPSVLQPRTDCPLRSPAGSLHLPHSRVRLGPNSPVVPGPRTACALRSGAGPHHLPVPLAPRRATALHRLSSTIRRWTTPFARAARTTSCYGLAPA